MHPAVNILPVFLPFAGCGNRCLFCDQEAVTNVGSEDPVVSATRQLETLYPARPVWHELAFYGGSFTCLDSKTRAALYALRRGTFIDRIRVSTRPDCITEGIAAELEENAVTVVELGVQSMSDAVLAANGRPYDGETVRRAVSILQGRFDVCTQIMTGMYKDSPDDLLATIDEIVRMRPAFARIYPTVVFRNTGLAELMARNEYRPTELAASLVDAAACWSAFTAAGVTTIRTGLPSGMAGDAVVAGPVHPAYGDLVKTLTLMAALERGVDVTVGDMYRGEAAGYRSIVRRMYPDRTAVVDGPVRLDWEKMCGQLWSSYRESREWFTEGTIHRLAEELVRQAND